MFHIVEVTETFNANGKVIRADKNIVFSSESPIEMLKQCYAIDPDLGYCVTKPATRMKTFKHLERYQDDVKLNFAKIFRIVEGEAAYQSVLEDLDVCINEKDWMEWAVSNY